MEGLGCGNAFALWQWYSPFFSPHDAQLVLQVWQPYLSVFPGCASADGRTATVPKVSRTPISKDRSHFIIVRRRIGKNAILFSRKYYMKLRKSSLFTYESQFFNAEAQRAGAGHAKQEARSSSEESYRRNEEGEYLGVALRMMDIYS